MKPAMSQEELSSREVSRRFRVNQCDVVLTWRRYRDTETVDDMSRSGHPKATAAVDGRYLRISARRNPESNVTMLNNAFRAATGRRVSTQTVRNRLHDAQLHSRRPWRDPHLTPRHHAAQYRWAQQHVEWTSQNWHQVLFTDECRIYLQPDNRRIRVCVFVTPCGGFPGRWNGVWVGFSRGFSRFPLPQVSFHYFSPHVLLILFHKPLWW